VYARLNSLQAKKDILNAKIEQELTRPLPCTLRLQALKRQRLRLEDKMAQLNRLPGKEESQQVQACLTAVEPVTEQA
jgi:hypothetical protein